MRACPVCGSSNGATDDFCGNCGAYLGWSGSAPARTPATTEADTPATRPAAEPSASPAAPGGAEPAPPTPPATEPTPSAPPAAPAPGGAEPAPPAPPATESPRPAPSGTEPTPSAPSAPPAPAGAESARPTTAVDGAPGPHPAAPAGADRRRPWQRRRGTPPAPPGAGSGAPAAPAPEPARTTSAAPDRRPRPVPSPPPAAAADADRQHGPRPAAPRPAAPQAAVPPTPPAPPPAQPAARPPATPAGASPQPVQPAKAVAPRPVVRTAAVSDDVSGVPCPNCGTPNPPDRRFCRRCAARLTPTTAPAPLPWWRTIWPFRRRTRSGSGRATRFLVVLAVVLALCAGGFLLLPAGRHLIEDTRDKLGKAKAVTATRVEASAEVPGHPVGDSTDGLSNRYWGAPGPGASATYTFAKPFRLVDVIITNGASSSPEEYAKQARALQIDMEVTTRDGRKVHRKLALSDKPGPQTFPTGISDATTVRLTLDAPAGAAPERHLALAEVEFFQRS